MYLPSFLIVGAMKAGTSTLFRDLEQSEHLHGSNTKEPRSLVHDDVLTEAGKKRYSGFFSGAKNGQLCFEASVVYTRPGYADVAKRAKTVLGPDLKIIYLVRNPVDRAESHHRHLLRGGGTRETDLWRLAQQQPALVEIGRYAARIRPWLDTFGSDNVQLHQFEEYVRGRRAVVDSITGWLGVPSHADELDVDRVFNASKGPSLRKRRGFWTWALRHNLYRKHLRSYLPASVRDRVRDRLTRLVGRRASRTPEWRRDTEARLKILNLLRDDLDELHVMMGRDGPVWTEAELTAGREGAVKTLGDNSW